jgi:hypothetical protein
MNTAIQTFTGNSLDAILTRGGDFDWSLNQDRAKNCRFLVCTSSTGANHGSSFVVGKISHIETSPDRENRHIIRISEFAVIDLPDQWPGNRNPVRYTTLEELGIDPSELIFKKVTVTVTKSNSLTIAQAKAGLSEHYGISPDNIEIIIKG